MKNFSKGIIFFLIILRVNPFVCSSEDATYVNSVSKKYHIILISICSLRADHLSCYGYLKRTSPNIDKLAQEGILFENVFSQATFTLESLISIHTSLYLQSHGISFIFRDKLSNKMKNLSKILKDLGYETISHEYSKNNRYFVDITPYFGSSFKYWEEFVLLNEERRIFNWINKIDNKSFFFNLHTAIFLPV